jgi:hypothetical protein
VANLNTDSYASAQSKFLLVNNTGSNLDSIINGNLIVNNQSMQPFEFIDSQSNLLNLPTSHSSGLIFDTISNFDMTMLYNDSALLSVPYLLNTIANLFSRLDNTPLINASITSLPNANCDTNLFDTASFTSILMFGFAIILPSVTFAVEIVYDKEVLKFLVVVVSCCCCFL